jgi:hypothetical protein
VLGVVFLGVGLVCDAAIGLTAGLLGRRVALGRSGAATLSAVAGATYGVLAVLMLLDVARASVRG